ncbi:MAG: glycoside hydrolase family 3 C-terminal domain-containing protein [Verrucomicrobia bacterium]|nr:glycoside hydrolase family 3 C-terminal domain-containing protein [Verrucomicrobiota bacterium]
MHEKRALDSKVKAEEVLARMSLEEKVLLASGGGQMETHALERLDVGRLIMSDGPHGVRDGQAVCFPSGASMGACWNPALMEEVGRALGREALHKGKNVLLGPCINIHRTPLGGRNFESFSEDPYLAARTAVAYIKGLQSEGVACSIKHFACNNQEIARGYISVEIDERALREIYLPAFRAGIVEGGAWTAMAAYNKVRGDHCTANDHLQNEILKKEWGFDGIVMSDWGATHDTVGPALGGLDLEMPGPGNFFGDRLLEAVKDGRVPEKMIDDKVMRLLRVLSRVPAEPSCPSYNLNSERAVAARLAEEAITLLKNDEGILPLKRDTIKRIAVLGPTAEQFINGGGGSSYVSPVRAVAPLEGLKAKAGGEIQISYVEGCARWPRPQPINSSWLHPSSAEMGVNGLKGEYFNNKQCGGEPVLTRVDEVIDFDWKDGSPDESIQPDGFSTRWTGVIVPPETGLYYLYLTSDDGIRSWLDGVSFIDMWGNHAEQTGSRELKLEAGRTYKLEIHYYDDAGGSMVRVQLARPLGIDDEAVALAKKSDVALVFVGTGSEIEGEGVDRRSIDLPGVQDELILRVAEANPNTVVVYIGGTPSDATAWIDKVRGFVCAWYAGETGGNAIADVLFGEVNPSGRLPMTWPRKLEDVAAQANYPGDNVTVKYEEGLAVGYRDFDMNGKNPLYPFGYGLSYTSFEYSGLQAKKTNDNVQVRLTVRNTGSQAGKEVVQLYVSDVEASLPRPPRELKAFEKIDLQPGEEKVVSFNLGAEAFSYWDPEQNGWYLEPGEFRISVGSSSRDMRLAVDMTL